MQINLKFCWLLGVNMGLYSMIKEYIVRHLNRKKVIKYGFTKYYISRESATNPENFYRGVHNLYFFNKFVINYELN